MKDTFEKNIKQSLENHEMPYNASAWKAMEAKLDVVKPVSSLPGSGMKWFIGAASVVVIGVVSYFAVTSTNSNPEKTTVNAVVSENQTQDATTTTSDVKEELTENTAQTTVKNDAVETVEAVNTAKPSNSASKNEVNPFNPFSRNGSIGGNGEGNGTYFGAGNENTGAGEGKPNKTRSSNESNTANKNIVLPQINDLCEGEVVTVENKNDAPLLITGPELHFTIPANATRKVRVNAEGLHTVSLLNTKEVQNTFFVNKAPFVDFTIDTDTKFEAGLPTTKLETTVSGSEFNWIVGSRRIADRKVNAHFYKAGNHDVTLTVQGLNGCSNSLTKTIHIDEKYNLMAVNSFVPQDSDPRNNTFMPFALTQRDVKFNLIIIDPTDGHIVYQTNNASNGWDGTDKTTGQQVNYEISYIWKVVIENAEPGEDNEYAGNITPIRRR